MRWITLLFVLIFAGCSTGEKKEKKLIWYKFDFYDDFTPAPGVLLPSHYLFFIGERDTIFDLPDGEMYIDKSLVPRSPVSVYVESSKFNGQEVTRYFKVYKKDAEAVILPLYLKFKKWSPIKNHDSRSIFEDWHGRRWKLKLDPSLAENVRDSKIFMEGWKEGGLLGPGILYVFCDEQDKLCVQLCYPTGIVWEYQPGD